MTEINEFPDWQRNEFMGLNVAIQRAVHQIIDSPKIFEDPLAVRIIGPEAELELRLGLMQRLKPAERAFRAGVMVRNRYPEDELARAIQRDIRQYVILGAGLDTFAYRNPYPFLRVFEVDYPATQAWKRECLEKAAIPIPESVTYVSIDLERQILTDVLRQSGFKSDELTLVSFIGVVRYLSLKAFVSVLSSIVSSMRAGSEVIFDFGPPPPLAKVLFGGALPGHTEVIFDASFPFRLRRLQDLVYRMIAHRTGRNGYFHPIHFDPGSLKRDLKRMGFVDVQLFGPKEINAWFLKDRPDRLQIHDPMYLVKARV